MITILFLAANPIDTRSLRLDEEVREIDLNLRQSEFRDRFNLRQHWAVRITDIQSYLLRHGPNIVHFSGHGSTSNEIVLEDKAGNSHPVSANALSALFSVLRDDVRCVVLNACYSKRQAQAIAKHIDCVIGMSQAIGDKAAIAFSAAFYQALGYGRDIKTAFELGCTQIALENLDDQDKPMLLALKSDPSTIVFVAEDETETDESKHLWSDYYNEQGRAKLREWATKSVWDWHLLAHAIQFYAKSIDYDPKNKHPWINLAYVYFVIGEKQMALEYLQVAWELVRPDHPGKHYKQVETAIRSNRSITGQVITPPPIPDWFHRAYVLECKSINKQVEKAT